MNADQVHWGCRS